MAELFQNEEYERRVAAFTLIPSDGGVFEFIVDGELLYSKKQTKRHAEPGEIAALLEKYLVSHP